MNEISNEFTDSSAEKNSKPQGIVDRLITVNMVWCEFLVVAMMLVIAVDVFTRLTLNYSWQISSVPTFFKGARAVEAQILNLCRVWLA